MKKIIAFLALLFVWIMQVHSYDWKELDNFITWKIVNENWEPIKWLELNIKTFKREQKLYTDQNWIFATRILLPTNIDRTTWEYFYYIWTRYSRWISLSDNTSEITLIYDENSWRITESKQVQWHDFLLQQLEKMKEEYYVPTWSWFIKFSILIFLSFISLFWIYLRWN